MYKDNLEISLWYIKDYLIVLFFSIFPIVAYLKKLSFKQLIHEKKTELFGLTVILLFINSSYTFPVFWEMIFIFFITILSLFIVVANQKERTKIIAKFFNIFLIAISLFMIFSSISKFINNINDIFTIDFWLSFGLESFVWIINLPVIYLIREMIYIERKVIYSDYRNRIYSYIKYGTKLFAKTLKFKKYKNIDYNIPNYIEEARELSAIGGNRIYIKLKKSNLSNEILIAIASDAILGRNKYTNINNKREKYPNVVEIIDKNSELCVFWQDSFVALQYRDDRIDSLKTIELLEDIKLVQR